MNGLTEILPGLFRWRSALTGAQQPVNSYVWQRGEDYVLIDPAADLVLPLDKRVTDILITHVQEEHAAGSFNFPQARVHVPVDTEYLCHGPEAYLKVITKWEPPWDWESKGKYQGHVAGARTKRPLARALPLAESLPPGTRWEDCEILATPGHGKHAITIVAPIAGQRVAFCGDLICGEGQMWNWFDCEWDYGLQGGQRAQMESARQLGREPLDLLCPAHGEVVRKPSQALQLLRERIAVVLTNTPGPIAGSINFADEPSPARGFRQLLPNLHQWTREPGNCCVLVSATGNALMVDDGLCYWKPLPERSRHHCEVVAELKRALGICRFEVVIPTHYHGDHIENIPELVALDGSEVVALDVVAEVIEHPERFNLIAPLPWYGTEQDVVKVDRRMREGERLRWHEFDLEFFHLGGQTYYHGGVDVKVGGERVVFAGDSGFLGGALCEPVLCYNDSDPATRGWAYAVDRLIERKPDLIACGHANAFRDPMPVLELKRGNWKRKLAEFATLNPRNTLRSFFDPLF